MYVRTFPVRRLCENCSQFGNRKSIDAVAFQERAIVHRSRFPSVRERNKIAGYLTVNNSGDLPLFGSIDGWRTFKTVSREVLNGTPRQAVI
jgi:hypothetical protein